MEVTEFLWGQFAKAQKSFSHGGGASGRPNRQKSGGLATQASSATGRGGRDDSVCMLTGDRGPQLWPELKADGGQRLYTCHPLFAPSSRLRCRGGAAHEGQAATTMWRTEAGVAAPAARRHRMGSGDGLTVVARRRPEAETERRRDGSRLSPHPAFAAAPAVPTAGSTASRPHWILHPSVVPNIVSRTRGIFAISMWAAPHRTGHRLAEPWRRQRGSEKTAAAPTRRDWVGPRRVRRWQRCRRRIRQEGRWWQRWGGRAGLGEARTEG